MAQRESVPARIGRRLVRAVDARLRREQGIFVFDDDPACILRISLAPAKAEVALSGGTVVAAGERLVIVHFWNERLPPIPPEGPDLRWARRMVQGAIYSLRLLAQYLASQPGLATVQAVGSDLAGFLAAGDLDLGVGFFERLGFDVQRPHSAAGLWGRLALFWGNVYSWALIWTYNPASVRGKVPWRLGRFSIWMSRATLERRYGRAEAHGPPEAEAQAGEPALATTGGSRR